MDILINKDFKKKEERIYFAEQVSSVINHSEFISNPHKYVEVVNVYNRTIGKARKNKNYHEEYLPFLFIVNKN
jgi:hypothetical protein